MEEMSKAKAEEAVVGKCLGRIILTWRKKKRREKEKEKEKSDKIYSSHYKQLFPTTNKITNRLRK